MIKIYHWSFPKAPVPNLGVRAPTRGHQSDIEVVYEKPSLVYDC